MNKLLSALAAAAALLVSFQASADSQATAARLIAMPGTHSLQLVDVGVMPTKLEPGTLIMICDAQCQAVMHLAAAPAAAGAPIAMAITVSVDAHSVAAKLIGGAGH